MTIGGRVGKRSGVVGLVLLSVVGLGQPACAEERFTFTVPFAANYDMNPNRLAATLAAPDVEVVLNYEPLLAVPGWTGRLGYCAQTHFHICVKKRWRQVTLEGADIARQPDSLSVALPRHHWFGLMLYRINRTLRIRLPAVWPGDQPSNIDILDISNGRTVAPVVDMHLPAPYVGIGVYRLEDGSAKDPSQLWIAPCDATLELSPAGTPQVHADYQAAALEEWLRRLTDSDWWATQIPGVHYEQLAGLPAPLAAAGGRVQRISLERAGVSYTHVRGSVPVLPGGICPGSTQYEFSWVSGELLAARIATNPDFGGPDQCSLAGGSAEALWWQGQLVSYTGPRGKSSDVSQWARWQQQQPACQGDMDPSTPDVSTLTAAAAVWWDYSSKATVVPGKAP